MEYLCINPFDAEITFVRGTKLKIFVNYVNPVFLVFIEKLLLRAII